MCEDANRPFEKLIQIRNKMDLVPVKSTEYIQLLSVRSRQEKAIAESWASLNQLKRRRRAFSIESICPPKTPIPSKYRYSCSNYMAKSASYSGAGGTPKVIVAHLYGMDTALRRAQDFAGDLGFKFHTPPNRSGSWYYPGLARMIVYSTPGWCPVWLPEQMNVK